MGEPTTKRGGVSRYTAIGDICVLLNQTECWNFVKACGYVYE